MSTVIVGPFVRFKDGMAPVFQLHLPSQIPPSMVVLKGC
jgi:hypothetical protein